AIVALAAIVPLAAIVTVAAIVAMSTAAIVAAIMSMAAVVPASLVAMAAAVMTTIMAMTATIVTTAVMTATIVTAAVMTATIVAATVMTAAIMAASLTMAAMCPSGTGSREREGGNGDCRKKPSLDLHRIAPLQPSNDPGSAFAVSKWNVHRRANLYFAVIVPRNINTIRMMRRDRTRILNTDVCQRIHVTLLLLE
ncbi:MAG: hypothetical protein JO137_09335, partial [Hyphomicrobiales bacterium]|nr:hypothetical protein [Hyphomicrobiales bacterium]